MKLDRLPEYFSPKSAMLGGAPCGTSPERLSRADIMAAVGLVSSKAAVGIELYLAKSGVLPPENIISYIERVAAQRYKHHRIFMNLNDEETRIFLQKMSRLVFIDYSLGSSSQTECGDCTGSGFIDAEVFTTKVTVPRVKPSRRPKDRGLAVQDELYRRREVREKVRVICKCCAGKGVLKRECRCRGRGEVVDKKETLRQGIPVYKQCPRCKGRGFPRLKDTDIFKALGVAETTWRRNYKSFFEQLVEYCYTEESHAERILGEVTR